MMESTERVQALLDKEDIREVLMRYARGIDRHDAELASSAYHPGAVDDHGAFIGTGDGLVEFANRVHAGHWVQHQHYISNLTIDLDGDIAHCESYFIATLKRRDGVVDVSGGRYVDRMERKQGKWAIAARACLVEWSAEMQPGSSAFPADLFLQGCWDRDDPSYNRPLTLERRFRDTSKE